MQTTMTIANTMNCSPFVVFEQDTDEVIMLINFYIQLNDNAETVKPAPATKSGETRIRVNDKTATGGWF